VLIKKERVNIQNNLKFFRQNKGLTQAELAKLVSVSETHYQKLEHCKIEPKVVLAQRLAKALGAQVSDLFPIDNT